MTGSAARPAPEATRWSTRSAPAHPSSQTSSPPDTARSARQADCPRPRRPACPTEMTAAWNLQRAARDGDYLVLAARLIHGAPHPVRERWTHLAGRAENEDTAIQFARKFNIVRRRSRQTVFELLRSHQLRILQESLGISPYRSTRNPKPCHRAHAIQSRAGSGRMHESSRTGRGRTLAPRLRRGSTCPLRFSRP